MITLQQFSLCSPTQTEIFCWKVSLDKSYIAYLCDSILIHGHIARTQRVLTTTRRGQREQGKGVFSGNSWCSVTEHLFQLNWQKKNGDCWKNPWHICPNTYWYLCGHDILQCPDQESLGWQENCSAEPAWHGITAWSQRCAAYSPFSGKNSLSLKNPIPGNVVNENFVEICFFYEVIFSLQGIIHRCFFLCNHFVDFHCVVA